MSLRRNVVHLAGTRAHADLPLICLWCERPIPERAGRPASTNSYMAVSTDERDRNLTFSLTLREGVVDRTDGIHLGRLHFPPCDRTAIPLEPEEVTSA